MVLAPQVKHLVFGKGWYEQTLTGAWTVDLGAGLMQEADPGGASRSATLPSAATYQNVCIFIKNAADAAETITFDDEDATVIGRGECAILFSNGTVWKRFSIIAGGGNDFGAVGILTDVIDESTSGAGTLIGSTSAKKLGFFGATRIAQPSGAAQADQGAMTGVALDPAALNDGSADNTMIGALDLTDYTPHVAGGTTVTSNAATDLDTTAAALELFRDEQAGFNDAIEKNFDKLTDEINANRVDIAALDVLLTEIRTALVNLGLMKGSA